MREFRVASNVGVLLGTCVICFATWIHVIAPLFTSVEINFRRTLNDGAYELSLNNMSSSTKKIARLRIEIPSPQRVVLQSESGEMVLGHIKNGELLLPSSDPSYIPMTKFKELDGITIPSKSNINFRVPSIVDGDSLSLKAMTVRIRYAIRSQNWFLRTIEQLFHNELSEHNFLIIKDYWTPVSAKLNDGIEQLCRESQNMSLNDPMCRNSV